MDRSAIGDRVGDTSDVVRRHEQALADHRRHIVTDGEDPDWADDWRATPA